MNNNYSPLVSVLMTSYNREEFIAEAIESVLSSTYKNFELIIVDDCSTDNTVQIAKQFEEKDERVTVYVNEINLGQFPNRNKASEYARGEYIFYVDSDDKILSNGINLLVETMLQHPQSSFGMQCKKFENVVEFGPVEAIRTHFFEFPLLLHGPGATIMKRDFFNKIGKYPTEFGVPGDMYFNLKATCYSPITLIPFDFLFYRVHPGQEKNNPFDYLYNNYKYLNAAFANLPLGLEKEELIWLDKKNKRRFSVNIIKFFFSTRDVKKTSYALKEAKFSFKDFITGISYFKEKPAGSKKR